VIHRAIRARSDRGPEASSLWPKARVARALQSGHGMKLIAPVLVLASVVLGCSGSDTGTESDMLSIRKVDHISTISYAPNSFVIGNAYPGWTDEIQGNPQFSSGPGNPSGDSYRWGFLFGENFDHCAWISDGALGSAPHQSGAMCGSPQEIDTPHFMATYTNGMHNDLPGDGSDTSMHYAGSGCSDQHGYGNVEPWREPATPANSVGIIPNGKLLKWRYVSKDGLWVLVRDPAPPANEPNWYFVHRGCVSIANTE
jgi:hypothetical protein